jgi:hypothetical protein
MNMKLNPARHQRIGQSLKALREESRDVQQSAKDCLHNMAIEMVGKNGCVKSVYNQLGRRSCQGQVAGCRRCALNMFLNTKTQHLY